MKKYDAIIIGFGKAGKTLAAELGTRGWNVAIIERSVGMYGGTCINIGCIPTKRLVHMSKVTQYRKPSSFEQYAEEFRNAIAGKRELTAFYAKRISITSIRKTPSRSIPVSLLFVLLMK